MLRGVNILVKQTLVQVNTENIGITCPFEREPSVTGGFPSQRGRNTEDISVSWRNHALRSNDQQGLALFISIQIKQLPPSLHSCKSVLSVVSGPPNKPSQLEAE